MYKIFNLKIVKMKSKTTVDLGNFETSEVNMQTRKFIYIKFLSPAVLIQCLLKAIVWLFDYRVIKILYFYSVYSIFKIFLRVTD